MVYDPVSDTFESDGSVMVSVEQHLSCRCGCAADAGDCQAVLHVYDYDTCQCRCRNQSQARTCPKRKVWHEPTCSCVCQHMTHCLDDEIFDFVTCRYLLPSYLCCATNYNTDTLLAKDCPLQASSSPSL